MSAKFPRVNDMPPKVVQIKGSNGSGKSTIARQLQDKSSDIHLLSGFGDNRRKVVMVTALDDLKWCLIGQYKLGSKMGGCDGLHSIDEIKKAIRAALHNRPGYNVLFEGMMISTIKSTFYDFLLGYPGIQPVFVILRTTPEACIERINVRGTAKPNLKYENIASKCDGVVRHAMTYDQQYVRWLDVDKIARDSMWDAVMRVL